jgi:hypothetical protein
MIHRHPEIIEPASQLLTLTACSKGGGLMRGAQQEGKTAKSDA